MTFILNNSVRLGSTGRIPYQNDTRRLRVRIKFSWLLSVFYSNLHSVFNECDAVIITSSYIYENASLDAMKQWFSGMQKEVHVLGPLLPAGYGIEIEHG